MSVEEDIELKNLVAQTLENKGILPKIRAELRANVFLALAENPNTKETLLKNDGLSAFLKVPFGTLVLNLIREFLEFFELDFTLSVFEPETKFGKEYDSITRDKMIHELNITNSDRKHPLLFEVIHKVVNINKLGSTNSGKVQGNISWNDVFQSGNNSITTPLPLNETFIKNSECDLIPLSPKGSESKNDSNESIKEELLSNNYSEADSSSSEAQLDFDKVVKLESDLLLSSCESAKELKDNVPNAVSKDAIEVDFLSITPIKETNTKEKLKNTPIACSNNSEDKTDEKIENKSLSNLGDLPPLTKPSKDKDFDMNDVKAIIDEWSEKTSLNNKNVLMVSNSMGDFKERSSDCSKSDLSDCLQSLSQKSIPSDTDDFKNDISDLMNGLNPLDSSITIDETISKASCAGDYLENI